MGFFDLLDKSTNSDKSNSDIKLVKNSKFNFNVPKKTARHFSLPATLMKKNIPTVGRTANPHGDFVSRYTSRVPKLYQLVMIFSHL